LSVPIRVYFSPLCPKCAALMELLNALCITTDACYLDPVMVDEETEIYKERIYYEKYVPRDVTNVVKALLEGSTPVMEIGSVIRFRFVGIPAVPLKYIRMYAAEKLTGVEFDIPKKARKVLDTIWSNLIKLIKISAAIDTNYLGFRRSST